MSDHQAVAWLAATLERVAPPSRDIVSVLTYHRVDEPDHRPELYPGLISATPDQFDAQITFLKQHYEIISISDLLDVRQGRGRPPRRSLLLTIDDAYRDLAEHAWPTLRRHGVPAAVFVPTAYPGAAVRGFWWDRLYHALMTTRRPTLRDGGAAALGLRSHDDRLIAYRTLRTKLHRLPHEEAMALADRWIAELGAAASSNAVLTWAQLRDLAAQGLAVLPHSRTHARLDRLPPGALEDEIGGSLADLERELGPTSPVFAYPAGGADATAVAAVRRSGFQIAFTTQRGSNDVSRPDWLRMRRINVGGRSALPVLRLQLGALAWSARLGRRANIGR
ncbi:MAG: polysaccharide deacetylase family protein [Candidatus Limnocylindria bacterium]